MSSAMSVASSFERSLCSVTTSWRSGERVAAWTAITSSSE
jgi:hypothetical protein